jgi:hypothetical protein
MKILRYFAILLPSVLLTGCFFSSTTDNNNAFIKRIVTKETVGKNQTVMFTRGDVKPAWGCQRVDKQMISVFKAKMQASFNFGGADAPQINRAKQYILDKKLTKVNLVQMYVPNEKSIMGVDTGLNKQQTSTFYVCKHPPAENKNPFKSNDK